MRRCFAYSIFFFNDTATTEIYTLSLHDALPICMIGQAGKLLARGLSDQGELQVQWKTDTGMVGCNLSYTLPERKRSTTYQPPQSLELPCVASSNLVPVMVAATSNPANAAMPAEVRNTATLSTQTV